MHRLLASAAVVLSLFASHAHAAFNPSHAFVTPQMFGAVGDDSHDDTAALQAWLTATVGTCGSQQAPFWTRGTYKISSTLTVTSPYPCGLPNLFTDGSNLVVLDATAVGNAPAITTVGQSGNRFVWQGVTINGGTAGSNIGMVNNFAYMTFKDWKFNNEGVGIKFYNNGANTFTEGVVCEDCEFEGTPTWVQYSVSGGTNSFRGTGLRRAVGNITNISGGPIVIVDAGAMPYLAPMDFTAWTGTAASVTLIQNNSTQVENSFIGAITLEGSGGPSQVVTAGSGSEFIYSGNILAWGISHMHKGTLLSVTDYNLYEGAAGKSYTPAPYASGGNAISGGPITIAMPFPTPDGSMILHVSISAANYNYQADIPIIKNATGSTLTDGAPINTFNFNGTGWGAPTITTSGNNVILTNASYTTATAYNYTWVPLFAGIPQ